MLQLTVFGGLSYCYSIHTHRRHNVGPSLPFINIIHFKQKMLKDKRRPSIATWMRRLTAHSFELQRISTATNSWVIHSQFTDINSYFCRSKASQRFINFSNGQVNSYGSSGVNDQGFLSTAVTEEN